MNPIETERLVLRELTAADAAFVLGLVNDPAWLRHIGDRGIRTVEAARTYLLTGPVAGYAQHGFGLNLVCRRADGVPLGLCGFIRRQMLDDADLGFAFMPAFRGCGYAAEAARATLAFGRGQLGLKRVLAITSPDNDDSIRLLTKLGFRFEKMLRVFPDKPEVKLFVSEG